MKDHNNEDPPVETDSKELEMTLGLSQSVAVMANCRSSSMGGKLKETGISLSTPVQPMKMTSRPCLPAGATTPLERQKNEVNSSVSGH